MRWQRNGLKEGEVVVQVIMIKYTEGNQNMKARLMVADGVWAIMAIVSQEVFDRMPEVKQYDVIKLKQCVTKNLTGDQEQMVLVLKEPPQVLYQNLKTRIGHPKELTRSLLPTPPVSQDLIDIKVP